MEKWDNRAPPEQTNAALPVGGPTKKKKTFSHVHTVLQIFLYVPLCFSPKLCGCSSCLIQTGLYSVQGYARCFRKLWIIILLRHHRYYSNAFCFLPLTINHLVHPEQKQYSLLRAMFKVYSKPCVPSLGVVLSQERLGGSGLMSLIKGEMLQLFGKCMWGENTWKWKIGMHVCVYTWHAHPECKV